VQPHVDDSQVRLYTRRDQDWDLRASSQTYTPLGSGINRKKFPQLKAWAAALINRASTHSFPEGEFEVLYRANVKHRNKWVSQFVETSQIAGLPPAAAALLVS